MTTFVPHQYQEHGIERIASGESIMLAMEMGLGKTVTTLTGLQSLILNKIAKHTLLIAPLRVAKNVWPDEIAKWDHLDIAYSLVLGTEAQRIKALKAEADVYIINVDNLKWLVNLMPKSSCWPFDTVVIDESSQFKNWSTARFKSLRKVRPFIRQVIELTGTPAPTHLLNLWSQVFLLDLGKRLGKSVMRFRAQYFESTDYFQRVWTPRPGQQDEILKLIADVCVSMKSADYLTLPPCTFNDVYVDLPLTARQVYDEMEKEMLVVLSSGSLEAANHAVVAGKCLQICNGAVYTDEQHWEELHDAKLKALDSIIEEAQGQPILLAYTYKHDLERLKARYKNIVTLDDGDDSDIIAAWNRGEIEILACHPASAGHGLNLQQGGHTAVWYGLNWSLELYLQFNARLDRQGQKMPVMIHRILARDTIDLLVLDRLANRTSTQEAVKHFIKLKQQEKHNERIA